MKNAIRFAAIVSILLAGPSLAAASRDREAPGTAQVVAMQTGLFDALSREDLAAWNRIAAPDFVAHERGRTYSASAFFDLVVGMHKAGVRPTWSVTSPTVEADRTIAVMSYVNVGSITHAGGAPAPVRWLETVAFRNDGGAWKAFLVTSMRVEDAHG